MIAAQRNVPAIQPQWFDRVAALSPAERTYLIWLDSVQVFMVETCDDPDYTRFHGRWRHWPGRSQIVVRQDDFSGALDGCVAYANITPTGARIVEALRAMEGRT